MQLMAIHLKIHHRVRNFRKYTKGQPTDKGNITQHFASIIRLPHCLSQLQRLTKFEQGFQKMNYIQTINPTETRWPKHSVKVDLLFGK